jgi:hypothetical protein
VVDLVGFPIRPPGDVRQLTIHRAMRQEAGLRFDIVPRSRGNGLTIPRSPWNARSPMDESLV